MSRLSLRRIALLCVAAMTTAACGTIADLPHLTKADLRFHPAQSSKIYAGNGRLITSLHGVQNRTVIPLSQIPKTVQEAVVAIEDRRFYQHSGVDVHAILRAFAADVTSGHIEEGGSTLTQQLVKNTIIAPEGPAPKTLERKIDEAALARQMEAKLSKKEILERYLNTVYFGEGAYGVEAAAKTYFGIEARHLTLAEAAMLGGVIQSPTEFDPYLHPKAAKHRRNLVLRKMHQQHYLGLAKVRQASKARFHLKHADGDSSRYPAPYFVDYVTRLIKYDPRFRALGSNWHDRERRLFTGGLKIYTTVDLHDQKLAEQAVSAILPYASDPHAALVSIDPRTGEILSMVGGRGYFDSPKKDPFAKLNLATVAEPNLSPGGGPAPGSGRQAGSSFKPFALATAIEKGVPLTKQYPAAPCMDLNQPGSSAPWHVCNYEGESFPSSITLLEATILSVNVVYAQLILDIGPAAVVDTAENMGIRTNLLPVPSAVLGTNPVNALDMASAYGTFATNGMHHPPVAIRKIVAPDGRVLYSDDSKPSQALPPIVSYETTTALEQVIQKGTGVNAQIGRPEAGKTGTGQEFRDAWFVGYTPNRVTAVWLGYPEGEIEMKSSCYGAFSACRPTRITVQGGSWPAEIWAKYMLQALADEPPLSFVQPAGGFVTVTIDTRNGCLADRFTPPAYRSTATFPSGAAPTETCREPGDVVTVPNVFGFPQKDATRVLESAGFTVATATQVSTTYPPGRVVGVSPAAGSAAARGSTVTITISEAASPTPSATASPTPTSTGGGSGGGGGGNTSGNGNGNGHSNGHGNGHGHGPGGH